MTQRNNLFQTVGTVSLVSSKPGEFVFSNDFAHFTLTWYRPDLVRVRIRKQSQAPEPVSYAVVAEPQQVGVRTSEDGDKCLFTSSSLQVEVEMNPLRIVFRDLEGNVLNEDDPLGAGWIGQQQVSVYKKLREDERFIGMGEKTGGLDRRGNAYVHWNTDTFGYATNADPLYLSTPFYIGLTGGRSYGIFLDNTHRSTFNFGATTERFSWFSAEDGELDYYFFSGSVSEIIEGYSWLTGKMPLPPKWSLGYQQCRYSYYPEHEVLNMAQTFREKQIPADVIYLDIHYMDGYRVFSFHPERFPDPKGMMEKLHAMGFHVVLIVDPGIKRDPEYAAFKSGEEGGHFVKHPDGDPYYGQVWPGWSAFPDFTDPAARDWWAEQFSIYTEAGIDGFWNDMNEPAAWGQSLPGLLEFSWEGHKTTLLQARNVYGSNMAMATRQGAEQLLGRRPFVLTRAGFSGVQRHAAIWTGDNVASDDHLLAGVRLVNSLGLAGIAFAGYDVGGFAGEASPHLYVRWIQIGAFSPFFRGHSAVNTRDSEPWSYGEECEEISRNYIGLRYQLMPYIFSCMYEAHETGMPLQRSLAIDFSDEPEIFQSGYDNEYLFGPSFLVVPVDSTRDMQRIYLPKGTWYGLLDDAVHRGGKSMIVDTPIETLPIYVRGGTVTAMQSLVQSIGEQPERILYLHAYAGGHETFEFTLYDDQDQLAPAEDGGFWKRKLVFHPGKSELILGENEGKWAGNFDTVRLHLHGYPSSLSFNVNGVAQKGFSTDVKWIEPISQFDPQGPEMSEETVIRDIPAIDFELEAGTVSISWS